MAQPLCIHNLEGVKWSIIECRHILGKRSPPVPAVVADGTVGGGLTGQLKVEWTKG